MKSYPTKFKSFLWKIVQMGTSQKLQNSIQTLTNFLACLPNPYKLSFWVIFVELPFFHFPPPNTSIRGNVVSALSALDLKVVRGSLLV